MEGARRLYWKLLSLSVALQSCRYWKEVGPNYLPRALRLWSNRANTALYQMVETEPQNTKEDLELVKEWQTKTWSQSKLVGKSISDLLVTRHEGET